MYMYMYVYFPRLLVETWRRYYANIFTVSLVILVVPLLLKLLTKQLKELSHEIEIGCWWYGWIEPYLEMNLWKFLKLFIASWFLTLSITFFSAIAQRLPFSVQLGGNPFEMLQRLLATLWQTLLQGVKGYWQPSSNFVIGCQRLLAILWQIPQRVLTTFANSTYLPEGCQHPLILGHRVLITLQSNCQRVLDNLYRHLKEGCSINKERGNLFTQPLKTQKVKINIQEATSFKNWKSFIF